jgi:hypothetical protein
MFVVLSYGLYSGFLLGLCFSLSLSLSLSLSRSSFLLTSLSRPGLRSFQDSCSRPSSQKMNWARNHQSASLAQWLERWPYEPYVVGSSPMDTAIGHGLDTARLKLRGHFSAWTFFSAQAAATAADCLRARALCIQRAPQSHRQSRRSDKIHLMGIDVDTKCTCSEGNAMNCEPHVCFHTKYIGFGVLHKIR